MNLGQWLLSREIKLVKQTAVLFVLLSLQSSLLFASLSTLEKVIR